MAIVKVSLFVEPLAFFLGEDYFMSNVDVNPPDVLFQEADEALALGGELISYAQEHPFIPVQKIRPLAEQQTFFERKSTSPEWKVFFASTPNKDKRYSVLVEFDGLESSSVEAPDPDNPRWGPLTGLGVWVASVAAIMVMPLIAIVFWLVVQQVLGKLPHFASGEEFAQWALSPNVLLVQIISTIPAHAITVAICWAVVTRMGSRPFWASLGWHWGGFPVWYWIVFSACLLIGLQLIAPVLSRFLPEADSPFAQLLRSSKQMRIAVAVVAIVSAPLVEEVVYRGVLFSSLRKRMGLIATVLVVTVTFAGVHVFQNRGAWVSIAGLTLLSLVLTLVRARTRSILPCVLIHTLNNAAAAASILINKGT